MSYESSAKHPTEVTSLGVKFTSDKVLPSFTVFTKATHELPPSTLITPLPILPKPQQITQPPERNNSGRDSSVSDQHLCLSPYSYHTSHTSHALDRSVRRASDPTASASDSSNRTPTVKRPAPMMTSEEILAEKRRRNAGASARFRDRRKQKEKDLAKRCQILEQRTQELEAALRHYNPNHALLLVSIAPQQLPALPETTHTMKASRFDNGGDSVNNGELSC
ncbi:hypothetical protein BDF20DRAFT_884393 [Mycotypha africana]|uniref:uncharacterized protein n=1 Tax=Mycotypha africana TaxID=64632 RepID=UPI002300B4E7|nr:uncharacterized protein BDF20DRAFT_884393 [Mycotypha africana]KAI8971411.1 hypothetical protein BDF20DRAFT_884393 [Mycotypha africana]